MLGALVTVPGTQNFKVTEVSMIVGAMGSLPGGDVNWGVDFLYGVTAHSSTSHAANNFTNGDLLPFTSLGMPNYTYLGVDIWTLGAFVYQLTFNNLPQNLVLPPGTSVLSFYFETVGPSQPYVVVIETLNTTLPSDWWLTNYTPQLPSGSPYFPNISGFANAGVISFQVKGLYQ
ncbi:MAG: hypothetical protein K1X79_10600 [Oligoflexia bacterium]|nr:hypothetical protein [Oligoflexia bacterium]